jgi:hypothetical protein
MTTHKANIYAFLFLKYIYAFLVVNIVKHFVLFAMQGGKWNFWCSSTSQASHQLIIPFLCFFRLISLDIFLIVEFIRTKSL